MNEFLDEADGSTFFPNKDDGGIGDSVWEDFMRWVENPRYVEMNPIYP